MSAPASWKCQWPLVGLLGCSNVVLAPGEKLCSYHRKLAAGWTTFGEASGSHDTEATR